MNIANIYISLPVTSRPEPTLSERVNKAYTRSEELRRMVYATHKKNDVRPIAVTPFDIAPIGTEKTEAQIMSECVKAVLEADICVFDKDWRISKGCRVEHTVASLYGKKIIDLSRQ